MTRTSSILRLISNQVSTDCALEEVSSIPNWTTSSHEGSRIPSRNPASDPKTACDWRLHNLGPIPAKVFQLTELVYNLLPITCDPSEALAVYTRCLEWYDDIFPRLQTSGNGTPFTLFVHMYYHFCLLCLFQPLIKIAPTNLEAQPRNICTQAARAILDLSESSTRLFSHLQVSAFAPHFIWASGLAGNEIDSTALLSNVPIWTRISPSTETTGAKLDDMGTCRDVSSHQSWDRPSISNHASQLLGKMSCYHPLASLARDELREQSLT